MHASLRCHKLNMFITPMLLTTLLSTAWGFIPMSISYQHEQPGILATSRQEHNEGASSRRYMVGSLLVGALFGYFAASGSWISTAATTGRLATKPSLRMQSGNAVEPVDVAVAFLDAYSRADWEEMRSLTHEDYEFVSIPTNVHHKGREISLSHYIDFKKASPDDHAVVQSATSTKKCFDKTNKNCSGGAVVEVVFVGTNIKPIPDVSIPAKGNKYEIPAVILFDIEEGKVRLTRKYYDMLTLKEQFGDK